MLVILEQLDSDVELLMEEAVDDLIGYSFILVLALPSERVVRSCLQKHTKL
jgi:hypothetical protein